MELTEMKNTISEMKRSLKIAIQTNNNKREKGRTTKNE